VKKKKVMSKADQLTKNLKSMGKKLTKKMMSMAMKLTKKMKMNMERSFLTLRMSYLR